jgi:hypothetical protein
MRKAEEARKETKNPGSKIKNKVKKLGTKAKRAAVKAKRLAQKLAIENALKQIIRPLAILLNSATNSLNFLKNN